MSVQSWLNRIWYDSAAPRWWLRPWSLLYAAGCELRRLSYRRQWRTTVRIGRPVVVVGNLSVGGTGKTPLVCWLAARLQERGLRPGVVTRGYGGSSRTPRLVSASDDPDLVGDEAVLIARRTRRPVAAGPDRAAAAQLLVDAGCGVIISDDGLQHAALVRDCEIAVIDGQRGFGNGWLLPAGPLREPPARLESVDAVVVNGGVERPPGYPPGMPPPVFRMRLEASLARSLADGSARPLPDFCGSPVHAVAGIGNPDRFFQMLRAFGLAVTAHPLADHARIAPSDILFADEAPVLMTEKDAVKCAGVADPRYWFVPVDAEFDAADSAALLRVVMQKIAAPPTG